MRQSGKSFRAILQALWITSKSDTDTILWVGSDHEAKRVTKELFKMASSYLVGVDIHVGEVMLPNGKRIFVKNVNRREDAIRGMDGYNEVNDTLI